MCGQFTKRLVAPMFFRERCSLVSFLVLPRCWMDTATTMGSGVITRLQCTTVDHLSSQASRSLCANYWQVKEQVARNIVEKSALKLKFALHRELFSKSSRAVHHEVSQKTRTTFFRSQVRNVLHTQPLQVKH